jgi:ABC-2 type transport system permease protein
MKPVVKWTLKSRRISTIWWIAGISAFIVLELAFYPSIHSQAAQLNKSFSDLSDSTVALFSDTGDLFSPIGYLSGQIFYLILPMLLGVLAIGAGSSLIAREERDETLELLLSRPISRGKLAAAKGLSGIIIVVLVGVASGLVTALMCKLVDLPVSFAAVMLASLAATALAISFGAVAFMVTMLGHNAKVASVGIASLFALGGYLLASLASTLSWLSGPSKFLPFAYYHPAEILESKYNWLNGLFILAVIGVCAVISWIAFRRRDLLN